MTWRCHPANSLSIARSSRSQDVSSLAFYRRRIPNRKVHELYAIKNCQVLVKNLNFVAGMTRRFVSAKRLIRYFSHSSKLVEYRAQSQDVSSLAFYRRRIPNRKVHELYAIKNCQVLVKNLNFVAGMTRHFVSAKRLIRYFSNSSKLVEHRAQSPVREVKMLAVGFPTKLKFFTST